MDLIFFQIQPQFFIHLVNISFDNSVMVFCNFLKLFKDIFFFFDVEESWVRLVVRVLTPGKQMYMRCS